VLALDPDHPLGAELNDQLNQHFQTQAESSKREMDQARGAASSAGATTRAEFQQAERMRQDASADFNRGEYTNAAQKFLSARDQYQRARSTHAQAEKARRDQAQRTATAESDSLARTRAELARAQNAWTQLKNRPVDAGVAEQPSYRRALSEEASAKKLADGGDLGGAARAYDTAASYLKAARREYDEAKARRAQEDARRAAAVTSSPTTAPVTSSAPTRAQEEAAIRQTIATYERALESENLDLFRQVKPNLTADEAKRLQKSFDSMDSHEVELHLDAVIIQDDAATVNVTRRDIIIVRGRSQNGHTRKQTFTLSKSNGNWVIVQIGQ